jgi:hypothetical protein
MLQEISFPTERLSANAFDTVIDIVLKDLKIVLSLLENTGSIPNKPLPQNIVTTYAFTGSAYVV